MASEKQIDELRLKAFKTNDPTDLEAYYKATSKWFQDRHYRTLTAAEQAEPAPAARSGAVKQLEWQSIDDGMAFRAYLPIIGSIRIEPYGVCGWWEVLWSMPGQCDKLIPDVFDTADEAKAAAQADYEQRILAALEPAEPATICVACEGKPSPENNPCAVCGKKAEPAKDVEREFNEVLKDAQAFNNAIPERMRRNARYWLRPDDEPATDVEPVTLPSDGSCVRCGAVPRNASGLCNTCLDEDAERYENTRPPESRLREALEKIAGSDAYFSGDQHARCVEIARAALAQEDGR